MLGLFVVFYLIVTLLIGWFSSRFVKSSSDFALAGQKMPVYVVASGLFATWFGSETILGATSEFVDKGILGIIEDPFGAALCLFLIGAFFAKPLYKLNLYTFSDYFRQRYSKKIELLSAIFMIPSYFSWIAAQLIALAIILEVIMGLPFHFGVIICAAVVLFYTYIGGMWSISITDTLQTVFIIIGLLLLSIHIFKLKGVDFNKSDDFFRFFPKERSPASLLSYFAAWITIGWGSIPQQDVFQRVLSANSEKAAVRGSYISSIMYLTVAAMPLYIALAGSELFPELLKNKGQMFIPTLVLQKTGIFFQVLFFGSLISAILSTCSAAVLAPATVVAENIIKPNWGEKLSDAQLLKIMRYSTVLITLLGVLMSFSGRSIYELVGESSALSLAALFVPLTAGLYWKKSNAYGAFFSMIMGTSSWIIAHLTDDPVVPPAVVGLVFSLIGMIGGSLVTNHFKKI